MCWAQAQAQAATIIAQVISMLPTAIKHFKPQDYT